MPLLFASAAAAQVLTGPGSPDAEAPKTEEAERELERKALALLEETVSQAQGLRLVENRVHVLATAAHLLWGRDERAARALLKEAESGMAALAGGAHPADPQYQESWQSIYPLRQEVLQSLAQHDAKLALDFVRATRQKVPQNDFDDGAYRRPDQELMLEMSLAAQVAAQDPKQALRMAEEGLSKGLNSHLVNVLHQVNAKDPDAASHLAGRIIKKLRAEDLWKDYEASSVAIQLLNMTRPQEPSPDAATTAHPPSGSTVIVSTGRAYFGVTVQTGGTPAGNVAVDERARRELIETIAEAALGYAPNRPGDAHGLFNALRQVMPEVERYAPARVAALRRKAAEFERNLDPHSRARREYQEVMQQGTIEALLEAAQKAPPEVRDQLYNQAVWRAVGQNDLDRARQIIEHVPSPQRRAQMLREVERQMPWRLAEQGNYEAARQALSRLPSVEERLHGLIQLSNTALSRGDINAARQLLGAARELFAGAAQNQMQLNAQLQLAQAYAAVDVDSAFQIIKAGIDRINELLSAAVVLNGFGMDAFKDGELRPQGGYIWNELIRSCASRLSALAPTDFARASSAAARFDRLDARTLAQLHLAQGLLTTLTPADERAADSPPPNSAPTLTRRRF